MAKVINSVLYSVGMNVSGYEAGATKLESIQRKIRNQNSLDRLDNLKAGRELSRLYTEIQLAYQNYSEARASLQKKGVYATSAEKKAVKKLFDEYVKLDKQHLQGVENLKHRMAKQRQHIAILKEEAQAVSLQQSKLGGFGSIAKMAFAPLAGAFTVGAVIQGIKSTIDNLDALAKRARDVGMTASQLQELGHQARLSGIETGKLDISVKAFNRNISLATMGTGEAREALSSMGISLKDSNGAFKSQSELLREVAMYFAQNAGEAENAGRATRLFGESGAEMIRIFEQGEGVVNKVFNAKGIDEAARSAEVLKNQIEDVSNVTTKLSYNFVASLGGLTRTIAELWKGKDITNAVLSIQQEVLNKQTAEFRKRFEQEKAAEAKRKEDAQKEIEKANAELEKAGQKLLSTEEQRVKVAEQLKAEIAEMNKLDKNSTEYVEAYKKATKTKIELRQLDARISSDQSKKEARAQKKAEAEAKRAQKKAEAEAKRAQKKAEAEAKRAQKKQKQIALAREEFELNFKIAQLEQGNDRQKAQAEAIKNAIKRNELMEKYGYDIETATRALQAQFELEKKKNGGKGSVEYSDKDKKKAQKILDKAKEDEAKGRRSSYGKKTLEQAQAILDGTEIKGGAVGLFSDAQKNAKKKELSIAPESVVPAYQDPNAQPTQAGGLAVPTGQTPSMAGAMSPLAQNPMLATAGMNPMLNPMMGGMLGMGGMGAMGMNPMMSGEMSPMGGLGMDGANPQGDKVEAEGEGGEDDAVAQAVEENTEKLVEKLGEILEKIEEIPNTIKDVFSAE